MAITKKFAVVLSGCGVYDGSEIHEATLSLYFIALHGGTYQIFAPDITQHHVINHLTGQVMDESRNVLVESARIARGKIEALSSFRSNDYDALLFPGGFGAAKNLSNWAFNASGMKVNEEVAKAIKEMSKAGKPIGALCISPVILAHVLGEGEITVGNDASTVKTIESMGASHRIAAYNEIVIDKKRKLVTSPCYMLDANIAQIGEGINAVVKAIMNLI